MYEGYLFNCNSSSALMPVLAISPINIIWNVEFHNEVSDVSLRRGLHLFLVLAIVSWSCRPASQGHWHSMLWFLEAYELVPSLRLSSPNTALVFMATVSSSDMAPESPIIIYCAIVKAMNMSSIVLLFTHLACIHWPEAWLAVCCFCCSTVLLLLLL
jgi:hypothetical protein